MRGQRDNYDLRTEVNLVGYHLKTKKSFRDWTRHRCEQLRVTSKSQREIHFYNIIIKYINDLDWQDVMRANQKI